MQLLRPRVKRHVIGTVAFVQQLRNSQWRLTREYIARIPSVGCLALSSSENGVDIRAKAVTIPPGCHERPSRIRQCCLVPPISSQTKSVLQRLNPSVVGAGMLLTSAIAGFSWLVAALETKAFGHPIIEGLVVAMLAGVLVRTFWPPSAKADPGVRFASRELLELAVCLMGLSVDLPLLVAAGPLLAIGVVLLVALGLSLSYGLGRAFGLPPKLAVLVACGNAICGNSAIAAVAPVIEADPEDVGSAIAFTAILGVVVVLGLPLLMQPLGLSFYQYGVLAGLTVYAVPQVLAAAFPVSTLSGQVGTLVKLVRVLMLGPVVLYFALRRHTTIGNANRIANAPAATPALLTQFIPWFIIGFLGLAGLRATGWISPRVVHVTQTASSLLTLLAMAALGLGCDIRAIMRAGAAIAGTVVSSLVVLLVLSIALIHLLAIR